jgi:anti-sigma regulatory factor (Ser/Thr protein kinase)
MTGQLDAEFRVSGLGCGGLRHAAFFYHDRAQYRAGISRFARAGLALGEPVFMALPGGEASLIGGRLAAEPAELACFDMEDLGRNPARIIPALLVFADRHAGQRVRLIEEPAWPGRSAAESCEAIRSDALINLALARTRASVLCPFDEARLPAPVIVGARLTHPEHVADSWLALPAPQTVPWQFPPGYDDPLPPPPASAETLSFGTDLARVRRLAEHHAWQAGLGRDRTADLVLSVSEAAANTLEHTVSGGVLQVWHDNQEMLCQISDGGWIANPMAGRVRTRPENRGHGLFVVNQLCDLVELRTHRAGTTIRMHMRRRLV